MNSTNDKEETAEVKPPMKNKEQDLVDVILRWVAIVVAFFCLLLVFWLYRPWVFDWVTPDPTITPTIPTSTPMHTPTPAPTWTPVPTMTYTPSPVPLPTSAFLLPAGENLNPAAPGYLHEPVVMDESNAIVSPDLSSPQWIPSSQISSQLGYSFDEPYYATFGAGSITWKMDTNLEAGYYEIFVMDTLFSSGGTLQFQVATNDVPIGPITGTSKVRFRSSSDPNPQSGDAWHSIGVYQLPENNLLSVSTQWEARDEYTIVAIDRVLVSHLPNDAGDLLQYLPAEPVKYILDDQGAKIDSSTYPVSVEGNRSWGDQSTVLINPDYDSKVSWEYPDLLPLGTYEVAVFIPTLNGQSEVTYHFYANDTLLPEDTLGGDVTIRQSDHQDGWVSLGEWSIPLWFTYPVELRLEMTINDGSMGEVAVDAVAFMLKSMPEILNQ